MLFVSPASSLSSIVLLLFILVIVLQVGESSDACRCSLSDTAAHHRNSWMVFAFGVSEVHSRFLESGLSLHCDAAFSRMIDAMGGSVARCDGDRSRCLATILEFHPCPVHFTLDITTTSACAYFATQESGVSALLLSLLTTFSASLQPCLDTGQWPGFTSVDWLFNIPTIIRSLGQLDEGMAWSWSPTNLTLAQYIENHPCSKNTSNIHDIDRCCALQDDTSGVVDWSNVHRGLHHSLAHPRFHEVRLPLFESLIEPASATMLEFATTVTCRSGLLALQLLGHIQERSASGLRSDKTDLMEEGIELLIRSFPWSAIAGSTYPLFGLVSRGVKILTVDTEIECSYDKEIHFEQLLQVATSLEPLEELLAISGTLERLVHEDSIAVHSQQYTIDTCHLLLMASAHAALAAKSALMGSGDVHTHIDASRRLLFNAAQERSNMIPWPTRWSLFELLHMTWPGYVKSYHRYHSHRVIHQTRATSSSPAWVSSLESLIQEAVVSSSDRTFGSVRPPSWREPLIRALNDAASATSKSDLTVVLLETLDGGVQWRHPKDTVTNFTPEEGMCKVIDSNEILRRWQEFRESPQTRTSSRYINGICKPCLGIALKWHADYMRVDPDRCGGHMERLYRDYDVVLVLDYHPAGLPSPIAPPNNHQIWLYMPSEPHALQGEIFLPHGYVPVVVDEYGLQSNKHFGAVRLWYRYPVAALREAFGHPLPIESRTNCVFFFGAADDRIAIQLMRVYNIEVVFNEKGNSQYEYYRRLRGSCKVAVLPWDGRSSAGQVIADGALMGVPVVSPRHKLFARLLLPPLFSYINNDINEIITRVLLLLPNPHLYETTIKAMEEGLQGLLDWEQLETLDNFILRVQATVQPPHEGIT